MYVIICLNEIHRIRLYSFNIFLHGYLPDNDHINLTVLVRTLDFPSTHVNERVDKLK